MKDVEEELMVKKADIDNLEVPDELEHRLRAVLNSAGEYKTKKQTGRTWIIRHKALVAALVIVVFMGIYNYDVFAYYGKKVLGYDEITFGSIKELNEAGLGQEINKSYKFKNGTEVILDGVMLDNNKLVAMYTLRGDSEDKLEQLKVEPLKGNFGSYYPAGGQGKLSEDKKEIRWVQEFETPSILDRSLTFRIVSYADDISRNEMAGVTFKLDWNKAIARVVKCDINQEVKFQGIKYKFETLSATPLSVVINGSIETSSKDDTNLFEGRDITGTTRRLHVELEETYLKDGKSQTVKLQGMASGMSSGIGGIKFDYEFDGLKGDVQKLVLNVVKIEDMRIIDRTININTETGNVKVVPDTDELIIKSVKEAAGNTVVAFSGENDVAFVAALFIGENQAKLLAEDSKQIEENGQARIEKTYTFEGTGSNMKLMFKTISHETSINSQIPININK